MSIPSNRDHWTRRHPMPTTPKGQAMVISANLREGLVVDPGDVQHTRDMRNFARRVAKHTPYAPDVLTLSEVIGPSARNVAKYLSKETGHHYVVAASPGEGPYGPGPVTHDTAIVVNADTMRVDRTGVVSVRTPHGHNQQTTALVKERKSKLSLDVAAVHYPTTRSFGLTSEAADRLRSKMARADHAQLERQEGRRHAVNVIAGDFNGRRTKGGRPTRLFRTLQSLRYHDALRAKARKQTHRYDIDHLMTQGGRVLKAGTDQTYTRKMQQSGFRNGGAIDPATHDKREKHNPKYYYSDHPFKWALVGAPSHRRS